MFYQEIIVDDMGDLEYIEGKVLASNYFQVSGNINAINDTIEFVPTSGKTAFLIEAKITMNTNTAVTVVSSGSGNFSNYVIADLKIDSAVKSKAKIGNHESFASNTSGGGGAGLGSGPPGSNEFNVLGLSLVGNSIKKIEIENVLDNGSAFAEMSGYLV